MIMEYNKKHRYLVCTILLCLSLAGLAGCGKAQETGTVDGQGKPQVGGTDNEAEGGTDKESEGQDSHAPKDDSEGEIATYASESAKDAWVNFGVLHEENPEIFAWIHCDCQ